MTGRRTRSRPKAPRDAAKPDAAGGAPGAAEWPAVLVVMGVSGSGKSTVGELLARRLGWTFEDGDWFHPKANVEKQAAGLPLTDEDRWPWLYAIAGWIDATVTARRHAVVVCSALKREYRAVLLGAHGDAVRFVFLDGSRELIDGRVRRRTGHFMPPELLGSQFDALEPPGEDEHPVAVSIEPGPGEIVEAIVAGLAADLGSPAPGPA